MSLKLCLEDGESVYRTEVATLNKENFYVDDGPVLTATVDSAISLVKKEAELCKSGGFHLRKSTSNDG